MGVKGNWHQREKEIPTDTALNPEAMVSMNENRGDYDFPYSGGLQSTSGESGNGEDFPGEVSKQQKE